MSEDLKVGDLCITVNSEHSAANNGLLVVIIEIDQTVRGYRGEVAPYFIRRVDGQVIVSSICRVTGRQHWGKFTSVWCERHKLRKVDDMLDSAVGSHSLATSAMRMGASS